MKLELGTISSLYKVKRLTEEDIPDIHTLCKGNPVYYQYMKMEPSYENLKAVLTELPPGKTMEDKYFLGFYDGNRLIAILDLITGYPDSETVWIGWFMMKKEYQGSGIGSGIIAELIAYLRKERFRRVRLGFIKGNRESEGFWRKNGFIPTGRETETDSHTVVQMWRETEAAE